MQRALLVTILLLGVSLGAPLAGAQASPTFTVLATDPAGDQAIAGPAVNNPASPPPGYTNIDILAVLARAPGTHEPGPASGNAVTLVANFSAPPTARQTVVFSFNLTKGPDSARNSTATGAHFSVSIIGTTVSGGGPSATAVAANTQLGVVLPYASIGASPGDQLLDLRVVASDLDGGATTSGPLGDPVTQDDSSAMDHAPDAGGVSYTLPPNPFASNLSVTVLGGEAPDGTQQVGGIHATAPDGNAVVHFNLSITNHANKPDTLHAVVGEKLPARAQIQLEGAPLGIGAGETLEAILTLRLNQTLPGTHTVTGRVVATAGNSPFSATFVVLPPPPPGHKAIPSALGFLTPAVTAMGLDGPLGDYAELAFLLFLLLMATVLLFLALFLVQTPWLRVEVEPRRALAAPGGIAEFRIRLDRARRGVASAKAILRHSPWTSALRFRGPGPEGTVRLDSANPAEGVLRVEIPPGTPSLERETVDFDIVPLDAEGAEMPRHRARGHALVQAIQPPTNDPKVPKARDIRLAAVKHEPPNPLPGGTVTTIATIHNDGMGLAALRVVLLVDGKAIVEERIEVAGGTTKEVGLPWTAGAGKNQVKVQVFLA